MSDIASLCTDAPMTSSALRRRTGDEPGSARLTGLLPELIVALVWRCAWPAVVQAA
jgi:hypothetical protein